MARSSFSFPLVDVWTLTFCQVVGFPLNRYKLSAGEQKATEFRTSHVDRTNFTVCRVDDNDRFGRDHYVHYGQLIRLGTHDALHERPHYVFATSGSGDQGPEISVRPRAAAGSHWRVERIRAQSGAQNGSARTI
ncbi:unnamed protein product [Effrenium voratum]|nr:unnamed protein product [Effrenium voratum]